MNLIEFCLARKAVQLRAQPVRYQDDEDTLKTFESRIAVYAAREIGQPEPKKPLIPGVWRGL